MNTARKYTGMALGNKQTTTNADASRPGSVKKQKQQRKAMDSVAARQSELSTLVGKLEDRDTQHQAFTSLLELIPSLDQALVGDLCSRIEKNKNPGRSSTRRMFVLVLAAVCKCHPSATSRLLPRIMSYIAVRLRDKETQVTDACAILCSAIALYVVSYATINSKGCLSPRKKLPGVSRVNDIGATTDGQRPESDQGSRTFEHLVQTLSKETNAVGEHATKCIAALLGPVEFDGTTSPPAHVMAFHGQQVLPYLRVFFPSLVVKMNESTQYASFSPTFVLLQAILGLAKVLKLDCDSAEACELVQPQLGSLVDAIEDVFRDGPRDDWLVRKRAIEVLIQLIDLFVLGTTATEERPGRQFFEQNLERIRRLVMEARHDPVSAVRDAALPAVFQFDALAKLFPRLGETPAPPSPFKRVYTARGGSSGLLSKKNIVVGRGMRTDHEPKRRTTTDGDSKRDSQERRGEEDRDEGGVREEDFGDMNGDEAATPHENLEPVEDTVKAVVVPTLKLKIDSSVGENRVATNSENTERRSKRKESTSRRPTAVPRIASPKALRGKREVVPFEPPEEDEIAFPDQQGDEFGGHSESQDEAEVPASIKNDEEHSLPTDAGAEKKKSGDDVTMEQEEKTALRGTDTAEKDQQGEDSSYDLSRADAAVVAAAEGEIDLALRLCFLEDDATLLKKVLTMAGDPCMSSLSRTTRTALCAAFLEFLEPRDDEPSSVHGDTWLAFAWLTDLSSSRRFTQQLDPRVARGLELRLNHLAEMPNKAGLVAADIVTKMGL